MIDNVRIQRFKGLADVELELAPVTVLVGTNGAGKTSTLQAIERLCIVGHPNQRAAMPPLRLQPRGTISTSWRPADGLHLDLNDPPQRLRVVRDGKEQEGEPRFHEEPLASLPRPEMCRLDPDSLARPEDTSPQGGARLAASIAGLILEHPDRFKRVVSDLARVVPRLQGLRARAIDDGSGGTRNFELLYDFINAQSIPQQTVSTGTLAATWLLSRAHSLGDAIFLIDDVEMGLHPRAQQELMSCLLRIAADGAKLRIVATTHSPFVVDAVPPDAVWVLGPGPDGHSVARRLTSHPDAAKALEVLTAGEFWGSVGEDWVGTAAQ